MARIKNGKRKIIASFSLIILCIQTFYPGIAYAVTSGPSQPEMQKFEPAGVNDMVDLFTGDFKQNIPLMDVGGYPVNLSYQSGTGTEDEGSWVGAGWSLNAGAVTRNMRGLPDDFNGDKIEKTYKRKEYQKAGGNILLKAQVFGKDKGTGSISLGIYKDNYYGLGAELGANISLSLAKSSKTPLTAGMDISSDTRSGVSISPSFSLFNNYDFAKDNNIGPLSGGFAYNTRAGLQSTSLGVSFNPIKALQNTPANLALSAVTYYDKSHTPSISTNTASSSETFNLDIGVVAFGIYGGLGAKGYLYREYNLEPVVNVPAYGYMNYANGRDSKTSLLDFNREKDGVFLESTPALPMPVATQDFFMATAQSGSQQFRPYYAGNYAIFDKLHTNKTTAVQVGVTIGGGNLALGGGRGDLTIGGASTGKWEESNQNNYLYSTKRNNAGGTDEDVYFKQVGEHAAADKDYLSLLDNTKTDAVFIGGTQSYAAAYSNFLSKEGGTKNLQSMRRNVRDVRTTNFTYLSAYQSSLVGLDKSINSYNDDGSVSAINRLSAFESGGTPLGKREAHHISEITVTDAEGKRMVYGIPVYNVLQEDVTFSTALEGTATQNEKAKLEGIINYTPDQASTSNTKGRDNLYTKDKLPPYATSYLLTGILSSDYVDVKRDGITDDDLGTAVKFNYAKLSDYYRWRAPFGQLTANYNEGFKSDTKDDKASYSYGMKEIWYMRSIESKTMIAIFKTSEREDALGVADNTGTKNANFKLRKLDAIELYNKAEWIANPGTAVPVKVVHFEYDYSLYPGMINNSGNEFKMDKYQDVNLNAAKGKLTLRKVYFTFGNNNRGESNPYEFEYDMRPVSSVANLPANTDLTSDASAPGAVDRYMPKQDDRWGTYKQSFYNRPVSGQRGMNNAEYPYTLQEDVHTAYSERELANRFASKWQLVKITTPTGGIINIEYEADDYAYVQNRRAMQMCFISGIENADQATGLITANKLIVELPYAVANDADLKSRYLEGVDKVFFKVLADLDNRGHYDYINGYASIDVANCHVLGDGKSASIALVKVDGYNPVAVAGWQLLRTSLPQFAYDNYDNSELNFTRGAIQAIIQAFSNLREIGQPFSQHASARSFANKIQLNKSVIRLNNPDYKKIGGGARVSKLTISDEWSTMSTMPNATPGRTASYGQLYKYIIKDNSIKDVNNNPVEISSGVASYEPQMGNEENPFHEPLSYTEKIHWNNDKYHYVEKPYCESYFPAPQVGYRKVTVINIGDNGAQETGYTENEFYTAKEFPVLVENTNLIALSPNPSLTLKLFSSISTTRVITSQGFKIELNDMHGKPKSVSIFNKSGDKLSSVEYFYNVVNDNAFTKELDNRVSLMKPDGTVLERKENDVNSGGIIGTDVELVSDMRDSRNERVGGSAGIYFGSMLIPTPWGIIPWKYWSTEKNASYTSDSYNSMAVVKVIHRYGVLKKVRTMQNGSTTTVENMVWDAQTGDVVLTKNQNEFNDYTYAFRYPAYMIYEGMSGAYKNAGATIAINLLSGGVIASSAAAYLYPGDELMYANSMLKAWVVKDTYNNYRLINEKGDIINLSGFYKILRSGRRNILSASAGAVVTMNYPVVDGKISFDVAKRVLDAKATVYNEEWQIPLNNEYQQFMADGPCTYLSSCFSDFFYHLISQVEETTPSYRRGLFTSQANNKTVANFNVDCNTNFLDGKAASEFPFYLKNVHVSYNGQGQRVFTLMAGDEAMMGGYKIIFDQVDPSFNTWLNSTENIAVTYNDIIPDKGRKYCLIADGCSYRLRRKDVPPVNYDAKVDCFYDDPTGVYTNMVQFHVVGPPVMVTGCVSPVGSQFNPYYRNVLGNWRAQTAAVYKADRVQLPGNRSQDGGTDLRQNGYYKNYDPYWNYVTNKWVEADRQTTPWIATSTTVHVDQKGNEVESKNPLNQYSTALFGYQQSLAVAVGANARHNEIMFDGFEDYAFKLDNASSSSCPMAKHFDWGITPWSGPTLQVVNNESHTGKYSMKLSSAAITINRPIGNGVEAAHNFTIDNAGKYMLSSNEQANGFSPLANKKYILSMWVKETDVTTRQLKNLSVVINGQTFSANVPIVEQWKRVEMPFTIAAGATQFSLALSATGSVYIDDVRIFPFDGQLNSYVYNPSNMRLMATLDENNFATLYEYDDEGTPIRVKKETDRGIMTIKENRSFYRRR